ncbi:hypothetical protein [Oceanobacillus massiliensis]|uniref:hypothetical protein n=1 Tax=Oceanobacillus massiliensis TaxID=1465765 RepID=UPI00301B6049
MNRKKVILFLLIALTLSACNNRLVEVAEENEKQSAADDSESRRQTDEEIKEEQAKIYKEIEKPVEEIVKNNDLKQMEIQDSAVNTAKDNYVDENEFARYTARLIFDYQSAKISPKEYFDFLSNYGAEAIVNEMPADEEEALLVYSNVQSQLSDSTQFESYTISKVGLNKSKREGYFYRLVNTSEGEAYYITTITKEAGNWKFLEDSPAPPFEIVETLEEGE